MDFPEAMLTGELLAALERDPEEVLSEVRRGDLSLEDARWSFGVVLRGEPGDPDLAVDEAETRELRTQIRVAGAPPGGA